MPGVGFSANQSIVSSDASRRRLNRQRFEHASHSLLDSQAIAGQRKKALDPTGGSLLAEDFGLA